MHPVEERTWPRMVPVALALVLGITIGEYSPLPWWWWMGAFLMLGAWCIGSSLAGYSTRPLFLVLVTCLGAGWAGYRLHTVSTEDIVLRTGVDAPRILVTVEARVSAVDPLAEARAGRVVLEVIRLLDVGGGSRATSGRLVTRLASFNPPLVEGERIRLTGWLHPPGGQTGPGEPDWPRLARLGGYRGWIDVPEPELVTRLQPVSPMDAIQTWWGSLRRFASSSVVEGVGSYRSRALVLAISLGIRSTDWQKIARPFQRVGVAHLLAISGMHLGIVVGMVLLASRFRGRPGAADGWAVLIVITAYLLLVTWRPPVVRAALMLVLFSSGLLARFRCRAIGLLALSAVIMLLLHPGDLFMPGFQLSFSVVGFLVLGTMRLRNRWFSPASRVHITPLSGFTNCLKTAFVVACLAWLTATPIAMHHFGILALYAVPAGLILLPVVALLLFLSFARLAMCWTGVIADSMLPVMLEWVADLAIGIVAWIDSLPASSIQVGHIPTFAVFIWLSMVALWLRYGLRHSTWIARQALYRFLHKTKPT